MGLRDEIARLIADTPGNADFAAGEILRLLRGRAQDEIWWCELGYDQIRCMGHHQDRVCGYYHLLQFEEGQ